MTDSNFFHLGEGGPDDAHRLVCALCGTMLNQVHPTRSAADQAADEHAEEVHPDQNAVVVLTVAQKTVERWLEDVLELAARAQRGVRVDGADEGGGAVTHARRRGRPRMRAALSSGDEVADVPLQLLQALR